MGDSLSRKQVYLPRTGKRSGTAMRDQYVRLQPGEFNAGTGQPLGASDPMFKAHDWDAFTKAFGKDTGSEVPFTGKSTPPSPLTVTQGGGPGWLKDAMGSVNGQSINGETHGSPQGQPVPMPGMGTSNVQTGTSNVEGGAGGDRPHYGAPAAGPGSSVTLDSGRHAADGSAGEYSYRGDSTVQLPGGVAQVYDPAKDMMLSRHGDAANREVTGPYGSGSVHYVHDERSAGAAVDDGAAGTSNAQTGTSNADGAPSGHRGDGMQTHGMTPPPAPAPAPSAPAAPSEPALPSPTPWLNGPPVARSDAPNDQPSAPAPSAKGDAYTQGQQLRQRAEGALDKPLAGLEGVANRAAETVGGQVRGFFGLDRPAPPRALPDTGGPVPQAPELPPSIATPPIAASPSGKLPDATGSAVTTLQDQFQAHSQGQPNPAAPAQYVAPDARDAGPAGVAAVARPAKPTAGALSLPMKLVPWLGRQMQGARVPQAPAPAVQPAPAAVNQGGNAGKTAGVMTIPKLIAPWLQKGVRSLRPQPLLPRGPQSGPASLPNKVLSNYA